MNSTNFQVIAPDPQFHRDAVYALLEHEWEGIAEYGLARVRRDSHYDWQTSRIGLLDGEIVTHYGVYDIAMRIGVAQVRAAGINVVVTHPDYRGRGLMTGTAQSSLKAMYEMGYDLSVVCNAVERYYERLGYVLGWPNTDLVIKTEQLPTEPLAVEIQLDTNDQRAEFAALYNRDNATMTGTAVRPTFPHGKHPGNGQSARWNDRHGSLSGYILFDINEASRTLWIDDSGGDPGQRLQVLGTLARQFDCAQARCERLSPRSNLGRLLRTQGCSVESAYTQGGGWMVQIINLQPLFNHLAPELERRLARANLSGWRGDVLLQASDGNVILHIDQGRVSIDAASAMTETPHVIAAGNTLAQLIVGTYTPDELQDTGRVAARGDGGWLLPILFPAQDPQMSNDDL